MSRHNSQPFDIVVNQIIPQPQRPSMTTTIQLQIGNVQVPIVTPTSEIHTGLECAKCQEYPIRGKRYKCRICGDNRCAVCSDTRNECFSYIKEKHYFLGTEAPAGDRKATIRISDVEVPIVTHTVEIHEGLECAKCQEIPIRGPRYKCRVCGKNRCNVCAHLNEECFSYSKEEKHFFFGSRAY